MATRETWWLTSFYVSCRDGTCKLRNMWVMVIPIIIIIIIKQCRWETTATNERLYIDLRIFKKPKAEKMYNNIDCPQKGLLHSHANVDNILFSNEQTIRQNHCLHGLSNIYSYCIQRCSEKLFGQTVLIMSSNDVMPIKLFSSYFFLPIYCGCISTTVEIHHPDAKVDGNYTNLLCAILHNSWK